MTKTAYHLENYWDNVAGNISERNSSEIIAGDYDPYYAYKRKLFVKILRSLPFEQKKVLEVGSGPGGNLREISAKKPVELWGVDVSQKMLDLSEKVLAPSNINLKKTNGTYLDFPSNYFDIVFTSTVLQHNTNEDDLMKLIGEICRVSNSEIYLFERTEKLIKGHDSNIGRPVEYYKEALEIHGFYLQNVRFLNIKISYMVCGVIRKLFNKRNKQEGQKVSKISFVLEKTALPVTKILDKLFKHKRDLTMMHFSKPIC